MEERDRLDIDLDRILDGRPVSLSSAHAPLLAAALRVREVLAAPLDPAVAHRHLELLATAPVRTPAGRGRRAVIIALAAALSFSIFSGTAFAVSSAAAPGEPLFGVKRAFERAALAMRRSPASRAEFKLGIVQQRLGDLRRSPGDATAVHAYEQALAEAESFLAGGGLGLDDSALYAHIQSQLQRHLGVLEELLSRAPPQAQEGLQHAVDRASEAEENVRKGREDRSTPGRGGGRRGPSRPAPPGRP